MCYMIIKRNKSVLHENKKCETCVIKNKEGDCCLVYTNVKDDLLEYICLCCDRNYRKNFDEIITGKRRFLQSRKHGRYYRCRLWAHKNSL